MSFGRRKIIGCKLFVSKNDCDFSLCKDCDFGALTKNYCTRERRKYGAIITLEDGIKIKQFRGYNADFTNQEKD